MIWRSQGITSKFQSTHPLRGATRDAVLSNAGEYISIHAPLAGCDWWTMKKVDLISISIHAPLAGCDFSPVIISKVWVYFNPRTPCGVRLTRSSGKPSTTRISIHAPLAGCDVINSRANILHRLFQSTHPLRGATAKMHKIFCAFCDNRQFYRFSPSGVPSVGALFTYFRGLRRAGAGANLPVNGCALGLRAKSSASPQAGRSACSRSVRFYSRTSCRGNKTAGCRVPGP